MGIIKPKELSKLGYTDNVARSLAIELVAKHCKHHTQEKVFNILREIHLHPERYKNDEVWGRLAEVLSPSKAVQTNYDIRESPIPYYIYGRENIDKLATGQMDMAMRLPVSVAGALMPDGCAGYGLPIGGVLATTDDVVIPYAVGKDIGCRMSLTVLDAESGGLKDELLMRVVPLSSLEQKLCFVGGSNLRLTFYYLVCFGNAGDDTRVLIVIRNNIGNGPLVSAIGTDTSTAEIVIHYISATYLAL